MKLLLAVDSVATAQLVAGTVAARPWSSGTIARVLTVIDYYLVPIEVVNKTGGQMKPIRREMERRAERVTASAVEVLGQSGVEAEENISSGDARVVIVDDANEWGADMIFVGSHIDNDIKSWLLGNVAQEVLRSASCSVEIVRAATGDGARTVQSGMRILLATDGSEYSRAAAGSVSERPWTDGTEVKVIGVVDPVMRSIEESAPEAIRSQEGVVEEMQASVDEAVEIVRRAGLKTTAEILNGSAKAQIVDRANEWQADLVVVGSHGRRGVKRLLLGSVSEFVANHAH